MKSYLFIFILLLFMVNVSAGEIGTFKLNEEMQITNYCQAGVCTFTTLESLEYPNGTITYPNATMTKNGQAYNYSFTPIDLGEYTFVTCGDSTIEVCDKDTFFVNLNGEANVSSIMIILLIFFVFLFLGYNQLNTKINYDKWYQSILTKYEGKNYIKVVYSAVGYNFIKNKMANYYFLGFPIIIILTDIIMSYNVNSLYSLFQNLIWIYSLGIALVAFSFFGQAQEFVRKIIDDATNNSWGVGDGK